MYTREQQQAIDLIFNSIKCYKWYDGTIDIGMKIQNISGKKINYAINPAYWRQEGNIPPAFYFAAPAPSPEARINRRIDFEFKQVSKILDQNLKLSPIALSNADPKIFKIAFIPSNCPKIELDCPSEQINKYQIRCGDLLSLAKDHFIKMFLVGIDNMLYHFLGDEKFTRMVQCPKEKRTKTFCRLMKSVKNP